MKKIMLLRFRVLKSVYGTGWSGPVSREKASARHLTVINRKRGNHVNERNIPQTAH
jgi:hypothetical protein